MYTNLRRLLASGQESMIAMLTVEVQNRLSIWELPKNKLISGLFLGAICVIAASDILTQPSV